MASGESPGLDPPQRQRLRAAALGALGFVLTLAGLAVVLGLKLRDPLFASRGHLLTTVNSDLAGPQHPY